MPPCSFLHGAWAKAGIRRPWPAGSPPHRRWATSRCAHPQSLDARTTRLNVAPLTGEQAGAVPGPPIPRGRSHHGRLWTPMAACGLGAITHPSPRRGRKGHALTAARGVEEAATAVTNLRYTLSPVEGVDPHHQVQ